MALDRLRVLLNIILFCIRSSSDVNVLMSLEGFYNCISVTGHLTRTMLLGRSFSL